MTNSTAPAKIFDLVSLGEAMIEFNQTDPDQPQYLQGFGGDTSNAAIAAARAGASVSYLTRLGADTFGENLLTLWARENVNTEAIETEPQGITGIYFVTHGAQGHAFTYRRAGSAASKMTPDWLLKKPASQIRQAKWLHLSGISLAISESACETAIQAMRLARQEQTRISFDSNLRLRLWSLERAKVRMTEAIGLCDLFLPSLDDMTTLTGLTEPQAIIDWSHRAGAKQVVLKLGAQGALISDLDSGLTQHIQGMRVQAVDATGAGDCFCGNLLARLARGDTLIEAANYANLAAALAVQGWGAVASLPQEAEVNKFAASLARA